MAALQVRRPYQLLSSLGPSVQPSRPRTNLMRSSTSAPWACKQTRRGPRHWPARRQTRGLAARRVLSGSSSPRRRRPPPASGAGMTEGRAALNFPAPFSAAVDARSCGATRPLRIVIPAPETARHRILRPGLGGDPGKCPGGASSEAPEFAICGGLPGSPPQDPLAAGERRGEDGGGAALNFPAPFSAAVDARSCGATRPLDTVIPAPVTARHRILRPGSVHASGEFRSADLEVAARRFNCRLGWVPAFAGMTAGRAALAAGSSQRSRQRQLKVRV